MRITNRYGLPETIVRAVERDPYEHSGPKGDISASRLIQPPQVVYLTKKHWNEIEEDVSDMVWRLDGQLWHVLLERAEVQSVIKEKRLFAQYGTWTVSGQFDLLVLHPDLKLTDYKRTSVWSAVHGSRLEEWEAQLNVLADLAIRNGYEVTAIEACPFYRDWSARQAGEGRYPAKPVELVPLTLWPAERRAEYIEDRVRQHQQAALGQARPCTDAERWYQGDTFAVIKRGNVKAMRGGLFDTEDFAVAFADSWNAGKKPRDPVAEVHRRPGRFARCEAYCAASPWCQQWAATRPAAAEAEDAA